MSQFQAILDDVQAACVAVLNVATYSSFDEVQNNILQKMIDSPQTMWVLDVGEEIQERNYSIDSPTYRLPVTIYLVSTVAVINGNVQSYLSGYLETLRNNIRNQVLTTAQAIEDGTVNASVGNEVMIQMLGRSFTGVVGGTLTFSPGLLYAF